MKKIKLLAPILGLTAITPMIAPVLASCGGNTPGSADELKFTPVILGDKSNVTITPTSTPKKSTIWAFRIVLAKSCRISTFTIEVGSKTLIENQDYTVNWDKGEITVSAEAMTSDITVTIEALKESIIAPKFEDQYAYFDYEYGKYFSYIEDFTCENVDIDDLHCLITKDGEAQDVFKATIVKKSQNNFTLIIYCETKVYNPSGYDFKLTISSSYNKLIEDQSIKFYIMPATPSKGEYNVKPQSGAKTLETEYFATATDASGTMLDLSKVFLKNRTVVLYQYTNTGYKTHLNAATEFWFIKSEDETQTKLKVGIEPASSITFNIIKGYRYEAHLFFRTAPDFGSVEFEYTVYFNCV